MHLLKILAGLVIRVSGHLSLAPVAPVAPVRFGPLLVRAVGVLKMVECGLRVPVAWVLTR